MENWKLDFELTPKNHKTMKIKGLTIQQWVKEIAMLAALLAVMYFVICVAAIADQTLRS